MDNMLRGKAGVGSDEEDEAERSGEEDDDESEEEEEAEEYSEDEEEHIRDALESQGQLDSRNEEASTETDREGEDAGWAHKSREPQPQDPLSRACAPTCDDNDAPSVSDADADQGVHPDDPSSGSDSQRSSGSCSPSPSLADRATAMSLNASQIPSPSVARDISDKVQAEVAKRYARQQRKYHFKKGAQSKGGRPRGSKRKLDTKLKVGGGGFWE